MVHNVWWQFLCNDIVIFLLPKRSLESNISKKGNLPGNKHFWPIFSYYWAWQTSRMFLPGCTRSSGNHCASWKIICVTPNVNENTTFWKTGYLPSQKQNFGTFHLLQSKMTNVREQYKRVHKVLWQLLLRLEDHFFRNKDVVEHKFFQKYAIFWMKKLVCLFSF